MRAQMIVEHRRPQKQRARRARARHLEEFLAMTPIERLLHLEEHRDCPEWQGSWSR